MRQAYRPERPTGTELIVAIAGLVLAGVIVAAAGYILLLILLTWSDAIHDVVTRVAS